MVQQIINGSNTSAIQRHLKNLQEKGYLVRIGNNKRENDILL